MAIEQKVELDTHTKLKLPALTLRDMISIVGVVITLTLAWGVFSTRISILEITAIQAKAERDRNLLLIENIASRVIALERTSDRHEERLDQHTLNKHNN